MEYHTFCQLASFRHRTAAPFDADLLAVPCLPRTWPPEVERLLLFKGKQQPAKGLVNDGCSQAAMHDAREAAHLPALGNQHARRITPGWERALAATP